MENSAVARFRLPQIGRRTAALVAAFLLVAAVSVSAVQAPSASAQATYTIPIQYGNYGLGYGGYGLGYGGYGLGYGGYGGYSGYGLNYGLGYGGYGLNYGLGYGNSYGYGLSYSGYYGGYGSTVPVYQTAGNLSTSVPVAVGSSWQYCTGPNGPVWVHGGQSTLGLIC